MTRGLTVEQFADMYCEADEVLQRVAQIEIQISEAAGIRIAGGGKDQLQRRASFSTKTPQPFFVEQPRCLAVEVDKGRQQQAVYLRVRMTFWIHFVVIFRQIEHPFVERRPDLRVAAVVLR